MVRAPGIRAVGLGLLFCSNAFVFRFRFGDFEVRVLGVGSRASGWHFQVLGFGFRRSGLGGFWRWGLSVLDFGFGEDPGPKPSTLDPKP